MAFEIKSRALGGTLREAPWLLTVIALAGMTLTSRSACQAPTDANSLVQDGLRQLDEGRSTLEASTLSTARGLFEECVRRDRNNSVCFYGLARTALYLARAEEAQKDKDSAKKWRNTAITDVQHAIELNDRSADAHALLADLYGAKITGMLSGMQFGPKANAEIQRAFQLDPSNAQAFAVVGRKYLYAPRGLAATWTRRSTRSGRLSRSIRAKMRILSGSQLRIGRRVTPRAQRRPSPRPYS